MATLAKEGIDPSTKTTDIPQRSGYFIGFGQVWCENTREQAAACEPRPIRHSGWNVEGKNGSVQNFDEFGQGLPAAKSEQPMKP